VADGRLGVSVARASGSSPIAVQLSLQNKVVELRATYASIGDELVGRMPLAYVQLVQILTDGLCFFTPLALLPTAGSVGAVCGTAIVTLFHTSIVNLAKYFLDPFNNEVEERGGDTGIGGICVATLLQEINVGSERWRRSASWVPQRCLPLIDEASDSEQHAPGLGGSDGSQALVDDAGTMAAAVSAVEV